MGRKAAANSTSIRYLHEKTAVEVSRTSALSRLLRVHGRFWGRLEDTNLSPSGERANLRLWLEHVAGLGGALEGVGRASPPSPSLSAAQLAALRSQYSGCSAAQRRAVDVLTLVSVVIVVAGRGQRTAGPHELFSDYLMTVVQRAVRRSKLLRSC